MEMKFSAALLRYRQLHNTIQRQDGGFRNRFPQNQYFPKSVLRY